MKRKKFYHFAIGRGLNLLQYRAFSHDVTAAILMSQNNETAAMLVSQVNPVGVELFSYVKTFFCFKKICTDDGQVSENAL